MGDDKVKLSEAEWRVRLGPERFRILREKGTERPFTGRYWDCKEQGTYACAGCEQPLFESDTKYASGSGWPSFYAPIADDAVESITDSSHGMVRTELVCKRCGSHLGHVFEDGPAPTGQRYCINSASLQLGGEGETEG